MKETGSWGGRPLCSLAARPYEPRSRPRAGALTGLTPRLSLMDGTRSSKAQGWAQRHHWHLGLLLQVPGKEFQGHAVSYWLSLTHALVPTAPSARRGLESSRFKKWVAAQGSKTWITLLLPFLSNTATSKKMKTGTKISRGDKALASSQSGSTFLGSNDILLGRPVRHGGGAGERLPGELLAGVGARSL